MEPLFSESQSLGSRRIRMLTAILPAATVVLAIVQAGFGFHWGKQSNASLIGWSVFLWLVYFRLMAVKLATEVRPGELRVGLRGLWRLRRIPLEWAQSARIVRVDPPREFGGYGIRNTRRGRAYVAQGNEAVELGMKSGR